MLDSFQRIDSSEATRNASGACEPASEREHVVGHASMPSPIGSQSGVAIDICRPAFKERNDDREAP